MKKWFAVLALVLTFGFIATTQAQMGMAHDTTVFVGTLGGDQVVGGVMTMATGTVAAVLDGNLLVIGGTYTGLSTDIASDIAGGIHIHLGAAGENGGVVAPIANSGGTEGTFSGTFMLSDEQVEQLQGELFYINIHTLENNGGEIRAQVHHVAMQ
jgi:hypothetical protein